MAELEAIRLENQQLHERLSKLPKLDNQMLLDERDRVLKDWRLAKRAESRERIAEALDRFIEVLTAQNVLLNVTRTSEVGDVSKKGQPEAVTRQDIDKSVPLSVPDSIPAPYTPDSHTTWEDKARDFLEGVKWDG